MKNLIFIKRITFLLYLSNMCKFKIRTLVLIFTILILLNIYSTSKFHYSNFVKFGYCPGNVIFHRKWLFSADQRLVRPESSDISPTLVRSHLLVRVRIWSRTERCWVCIHRFKARIFSFEIGYFDYKNDEFKVPQTKNYAEIGLDGFWKVSKHLKISIFKIAFKIFGCDFQPK